MGKSKSSAAPQPFQPSAPQSSFGNNVNYAPMSGYTRAGQGVTGVDMGAIQQRVMAERQRQEQLRMQQMQAQQGQSNYMNAAVEPGYGGRGLMKNIRPAGYYDPNGQFHADRSKSPMANLIEAGLAARQRRGNGNFIAGADMNRMVQAGQLTPQQAMAIQRRQDK